jgi:hypothetical protein
MQLPDSCLQLPQGKGFETMAKHAVAWLAQNAWPVTVVVSVTSGTAVLLTCTGLPDSELLSQLLPLVTAFS